jgi:hypothetical protein
MNLKSLKRSLTLFTNLKLCKDEEMKEKSGDELALLPIYGLITALVFMLVYNLKGYEVTAVSRMCYGIIIPVILVGQFVIRAMKGMLSDIFKVENNIALSALALIYYILLMACYMFLNDKSVVLIVSAGFVLSRSVAVVLFLASTGSKTSEFMPSTSKQKFVSGSIAVVGIVGAMILMEGSNPIAGVVTLLATVVFSAVYSKISEKKRGGFGRVEMGVFVALAELVIAFAAVCVGALV